MWKILKSRIVDNWQTTLMAVIIFVGFHWYNEGKIDFEDFREYIALASTIILLFMKDWKKKEQE